MTFQPMCIYHTPGLDRSDCIIRYISNRVLNNNKNFICAIVGPTGVGKSWCALALAEDLKERNKVTFNPEKQIVSSVKQVLELIKDRGVTKEIENGSPIVFEEPQVSANSRNWHDESNKMLSTMLSIFRSERLVVFFTTPFLEDIDKQSRKLFHAKFEVLSFDVKEKQTLLKPRFIEYNPICPNPDGFYKRMLINQYAIEGKHKYGIEKVHTIKVNSPSKELTDIYESIKAKYNREHYLKMLRDTERAEKKAEKHDAKADFLRIKEIYIEDGDNYDRLLAEFPHITPITMERYLSIAKRSLKATDMATKRPNSLTPQ